MFLKKPRKSTFQSGEKRTGRSIISIKANIKRRADKRTMAEKTNRKRNLITIYMKDEYRDVIERFDKLIEKDEKLQQLRSKKKDGLRSVVIMELILNYVEEQESKNETSN